jgi:precorrin-3B C17-methyltransferase
MTGAALRAMDEADVLCGYGVYIDLVRPLYPDKPVLTTPMTREIDRCRMALSAAAEGRSVALVCSGDAGVYGMAGLVYELAGEFAGVEISVVPGVTAALSGAAVLGAPLSHDFAVISLSDLLTPWETIEKRLLLAAEGDFCIALYNPASRKRADYLQRACDLLLRYKAARHALRLGAQHRPRGAGEQNRDAEGAERTSELDMFCTVFVGNSDDEGGRGEARDAARLRETSGDAMKKLLDFRGHDRGPRAGRSGARKLGFDVTASVATEYGASFLAGAGRSAGACEGGWTRDRWEKPF